MLYAKGVGPHPAVVEYCGETYVRFHDFIYLERPLDELDKCQVFSVCRLRDQFAGDSGMHPNLRVREKIRQVAEVLSPKVLLELGPGNSPLFSASSTNFQYKLADLDEEVVRNLTSNGYSATLFDDDSLLPTADSSIDVIVAIFVFQFSLSATQIDEIVRVLCSNGLLVANVYRRSESSRKCLRSEFEDRGCKISIVDDSSEIGHNHQYWVVGREDCSPIRSVAIDSLKAFWS